MDSSSWLIMAEKVIGEEEAFLLLDGSQQHKKMSGFNKHRNSQE